MQSFNRFLMNIVVLCLLIMPAMAGDFQMDLSSLRNKIVPMCVQLKAGKPKESKAQLLAEIDAIIEGWKNLSEIYGTNPPAEYAKDPAWQKYFLEALDNFEIMQARVEQGNYDRAKQFCGMNCGLFVTMNKINGISKLTDKMFIVRKNVNTIIKMAKSQNWQGAENLFKHNEPMLAVMLDSATPQKADKAVFEQEMQNINKAYEGFRTAVIAKNINEADTQFKKFMKTFGAVYVKYL